ncbi:MAG: thioredoxin family protein [Oscillospiraceae bacterium]|nr:thioredoxin family protein [Oscillospiraceae bacterium]
MRSLLIFYLEDCGYCRKAKKAMAELLEEEPRFRAVAQKWIEESLEPELADRYDYYAVPSVFADGEKLFEAHIGMSAEDIKRELRQALELAVSS